MNFAGERNGRRRQSYDETTALVRRFEASDRRRDGGGDSAQFGRQFGRYSGISPACYRR